MSDHATIKVHVKAAGLVETMTDVVVESFLAGMKHAVNLEKHWESSECDGVDALRKHIRREIKMLEKTKKLPVKL